MSKPQSRIPSVDQVLRSEIGRVAVARFGHAATLGAVRAEIDALRASLRSAAPAKLAGDPTGRIATCALDALTATAEPRQRRVFNLTGTVLHTNLGRAIYAEAAIAAAATAMRHPTTLEYDLATGARGERDDHVRSRVCALTGAEDACLVNNNAAAVLLVLAALAAGRDTIVSRGELIEIGGSFRMPAIMASAGTRLVEVGTTNRTHLADYAEAIGPETALVMKVHTSNYLIEGFTKEVATAALAPLARERGVPLVDDLGSGTLIDLSRHGLKRERSVQDAINDGADLVTFSGDKLLGGPQAGFIIGRRDLVRACAKHPLKRAVRLDKVRLAALEVTLQLYADPDRLAERLPTLATLTRPPTELSALAERIAPLLAAAVGPTFAVTVVDCMSQIGSGALPLEAIPSRGLAIRPAARPSAGAGCDELAVAFRRLPIPVIGRIAKGALVLDLRCMDDVEAFLGQLGRFAIPAKAAR